jgi:hypothetical protein
VAKEIEKIACQYCGKEIAKVGIKNHEKSCPENPANKVPAEGENQSEENLNVSDATGAPEEGAETSPELKIVAEDEVIEKEVEVQMKESIECYIGNKYWRLKAKERYTVPASVKEILKNAGLLEAL